MSNDERHKYNNHLDKKSAHIKPPGPLVQPDRMNAYNKEVFAQKIPILFDLIDYFAIPKNDPDLWFKLAICLADKHVNAMTIAKTTGQKKWDWRALAGLHGLYRIISEQFPNHSRQQIFKKMKEKSRGTFMEDIIHSTNVDNLEKRYDERNKEPQYQTFIMMIEKLENFYGRELDQIAFFENWLKEKI